MHDSMAILKTGLLSSTASLDRGDQAGFMTELEFNDSLKSPKPSDFELTMPAVNSKTPLLIASNRSPLVEIFIPSVKGVEQEAGYPRTPSISTRQVRQAPIGFISGSLHNWDILVPDILMASRTELPSGAVKSFPFIETFIQVSLRSDEPTLSLKCVIKLNTGFPAACPKPHNEAAFTTSAN